MPYTVKDVSNGLDHLRTSLREGLTPVLRVPLPQLEMGNLIIPREVFACVEFLGALYSGYGGERDSRHRLIATGRKSVRFIQEIFGQIDATYACLGELFYEMYRHGTVHLQRPNRLRRADGATIEWVLYVGGRGDQIKYEGQVLTAKHLEPYLFDASNKRYILPLSNNILFDDLLQAIDLYEEELKTKAARNDNTLLDNYGKTIDALNESDDTTLNW